MADCSFCAQFGELYGFQPILIDPTMYKLTASSSSEEEIDNSVQLLPVSSSSTPIVDVSNTANSDKKSTTTAVVAPDDDGEVKTMLDMVLEAVRQTPPNDSKKAVSIYKIKQYLRLQHRVTKAEMTKQLKPTMETALNRKLLIKVSGTGSVLLGSVKLNPAHEKPASDSESTGDEEPAAAPETAKAAAKKRKAGGEESTKSVRASKRLKV